MKLETTNRYFLVFYDFKTYEGFSVKGVASIIMDNSYLNLNETIKMIAEDISDTDNLIITNVIELSKSDYLDWNK